MKTIWSYIVLIMSVVGAFFRMIERKIKKSTAVWCSVYMVGLISAFILFLSAGLLAMFILGNCEEPGEILLWVKQLYVLIPLVVMTVIWLIMVREAGTIEETSDLILDSKLGRWFEEW